MSPSQSVWDFGWLDLVEVLCVSHRQYKFMFTMVLPCLANTVPYRCGSYNLSTPSFMNLGRRCDIDVLYRVEHATVPYPLHSNWLWVSVLIAIYSKKKMPLQTLQATKKPSGVPYTILRHDRLLLLLCYSLEVDGKTLLLKTGHAENKLVLTQKLHPHWLAFKWYQQVSVHATKGEKSCVSYS